MTEESFKTIQCAIVICNWRYTTFKKVYPQGKNSMDRIVQAGCAIETYEVDEKNNRRTVIMAHNPTNNHFNEDTNCVPIRISDVDDVNVICTDWCTSGSPLKELNYDSIPRWWPADWIFKNPGELPDLIRIDLGRLSKEHIVLECEVVKKPTSEVMCTSFSDIFIEGIDDQNLIVDRKLDNDKDKNDDIVGDNYDVIGENMLFGKKKSKEETEIKSEVSKILETPEQTNDEPAEVEETVSDSNISNDSNKEKTTMSEKNETEVTTTTEAPAKKTRKKVPTWAKIVGGTIIIAGATTATVLILKKVKSGKASK